jgi:ornithine cyclodeaminase/alanine dehydrogenase-like protein (mu-crystallin family)
MAIIGNGAQSEFQALTLHEMLSIKEIRIFDIDRNASLQLKLSLKEWIWSAQPWPTGLVRAVNCSDY